MVPPETKDGRHMTSLKRPKQTWLLDPEDRSTLALIRHLSEELLPFGGRPLHELESAVMEMNLKEGKESIRKLRSELTEGVVEGKPVEVQGGMDPSEIRIRLFASLWSTDSAFPRRKAIFSPIAMSSLPPRPATSMFLPRPSSIISMPILLASAGSHSRPASHKPLRLKPFTRSISFASNIG